jgi:hypothetical protein
MDSKVQIDRLSIGSEDRALFGEWNCSRLPNRINSQEGVKLEHPASTGVTSANAGRAVPLFNSTKTRFEATGKVSPANLASAQE